MSEEYTPLPKKGVFIANCADCKQPADFAISHLSEVPFEYICAACKAKRDEKKHRDQLAHYRNNFIPAWIKTLREAIAEVKADDPTYEPPKL